MNKHMSNINERTVIKEEDNNKKNDNNKEEITKKHYLLKFLFIFSPQILSFFLVFGFESMHHNEPFLKKFELVKSLGTMGLFISMFFFIILMIASYDSKKKRNNNDFSLESYEKYLARKRGKDDI